MRKIISCCIAIVLSSAIFAQDSLTIIKKEVFHFASTRPAFTEGALLVPTNKAQIEFCTQYSFFNSTTHAIEHPSFVIKYGISKFFEFRVNGTAATYINDSSRQTGLHPISIGLKLKMLNAKRYAPASSFIGGLSANVIATKNFKTTHLAPYFRILMEQFLPKNVGLMYNYGLVWNGEDAKPTYNLAIATTYTKALQNAGEKHHQFKYFFELYAIYPHGEKFDLRINNGFSYLLNKFLQFDVSVGAGLLKNSPRFITSAGLAIRFPKKDKAPKHKEED